MKQIYKIAAMCLAMGAIASPSFAEEDGSYTIAVLTFENDDYKGDGNMLGEKNWSSLIDSPEYGGKLLYGADGYGIYDAADNYWWYDQNNTDLYSELNCNYGSYAYWNGGVAISDYVTNDYAGCDFEEQLEAFSTTGKGGYDDSDNFAVAFGYLNEWSDDRPTMTFKDTDARVIDHLYLALNAYTLNVLLNGNSMSPAATPENYVKVVFEGLDAEGESTGIIEQDVLTEGVPLIGYIKVDLSGLGAIKTLRLNMLSDIDNGSGMSVPAYYILDNIAVRIPTTTAINSVKADTDGQDVIYNIQGIRVNDTSRPGLYIINGKKVYVK
ncbi:MAG: DUF4465 domain-containing protein [Bacteroidales bacterium]|nr:DUF4465 domain-containing protein [Bacteroidales bacterium]